MSDNPGWSLVATVAIIALSAFFVAVEFALMAAKRHRLEDAAATSRSARAALRSSSELTLLLAGSQLGITVCTLALGAITKPAVHHWLTPLFDDLGAAAGRRRRRRVRPRPDHRHLPPPGGRGDGAEVVGDRPPRAVRDPARAADAGVHGAVPPAAAGAQRRGERAAAQGRRRAVERASRSGTAPTTCGTWSSTRPTSARWTRSYSAQISGALELERLTVRELVTPGARARVGARRRDRRRRPRGHAPHRAPAHPARRRPASASPAWCTSATRSPHPTTRRRHRSPARCSPSTRTPPCTPRSRRCARRATTSPLVIDADGVVGVVTLADVLRRLFPRGEVTAA